MSEEKTNIQQPKKPDGCLISFASVIVIGIVWFLVAVANTSPNYDNNRTYYDTGKFEDMTENELNDYLEWKDKQKGKEKIFD